MENSRSTSCAADDFRVWLFSSASLLSRYSLPQICPKPRHRRVRLIRSDRNHGASTTRRKGPAAVPGGQHRRTQSCKPNKQNKTETRKNRPLKRLAHLPQVFIRSPKLVATKSQCLSALKVWWLKMRDRTRKNHPLSATSNQHRYPPGQAGRALVCRRMRSGVSSPPAKKGSGQHLCSPSVHGPLCSAQHCQGCRCMY